MSYLLETLGRGLLGRLYEAFEKQLPRPSDESAAEIEERVRLACTSADLHLQHGAALFREGRLRAAEDAFRRAMTLAHTAPAPRLGLACVADEQGRTDEARRWLREAQNTDPNDPAIAFTLGLCAERDGEGHAANSGYQQTLRLCPRLRNAHERLAALAVREGDWPEAVRSYSRLADLEPDNLDMLLTLGTLHLQADDTDAAIDIYQRALLVEPESEPTDDPSANPADQEEAIATLRNLIGTYPGVGEFRVHLADLLVKTGDDAGAIEQYHAALEINPGFLEATVKLGAQHLRRGRYEDAAAQFTRAVDLNDRLLLGFVGLGLAQHTANLTEDAHATFNLAASLAPNSTLLFGETARIRLRAKHATNRGEPPQTAIARSADQWLEESLRHHTQALHSQPANADLHYRCGLLSRQLGRPRQALRSFESAAALNPLFSRALVKLGICRHEFGLRDKALEAFRQALLIPREHVETHYQLGLLFTQRAVFDLSIERFETLAQQQGDADPLATRERITTALENLGLLDRAGLTWRAIEGLSRREEALETGRPVLEDE